MNGAFSRATRPPSWSTLTQSGRLGRQRLDVVRQLGHLLRRLDVAREQDHAAERELARQRSQLRRDRRARQAADQQLADVAADGAGHGSIIELASSIILCVIIRTSAPTRIDLAGGTIDIWPLYLFHPGAQTLNAAISLRASAQIERAIRRADRDPVDGHRRHRRSRRLARAPRTIASCGCSRCSCTSSKSAGITLTTTSRVAGRRGHRGLVGAERRGLRRAGRVEAHALRARGAAADRDERRGAGDQRSRPGCRTTGRRSTAASRRSSSRPTASDACRSTSISASSSGASCSATPASRATRAPTTGRSPSGTSTAISTSSTASSASATRPRRCATALTARRLGRRRAARSREEWENRKRLAPGVTTPAIDDLIARATAAGATAAKVCGAGGGGCLFCYGPPERPRGDSERAGRRRRAPPRLHLRAPRARAWITARDRAGPGRDRRPARDQGRERVQDPRIPDRQRRRGHLAATRLRSSTSRSSARFPASARTSPRAIRELAETGTCALSPGTARSSSRRRFSTCCACRASGPKTVAMLYATLNIKSLDDLAAAAKAGRLAGLKGMGAKKEALILEGDRGTREGRRPASARATRPRLPRRLVDYPRRTTRRDVEFIPVGSLRRGCETCGDIDILAVGGEPGLMDALVSHPHVERVLGQGDTKSSVLLRGGYQADLRLVPPESRGAAMQYFTGSKAHNIACATAPSSAASSSTSTASSAWTTTAVSPARPRKGSTRRSAWTGSSRSSARTAAKSRRRGPARCRAHHARRPARRPAHAHDGDRRQRRPRGDGAGRAPARPRVHRDHRSQPGAGHGQRPRREARARTRRPRACAERSLRRT